LRRFLLRPGAAQEFLWFTIKQGWACIFGALLLAALIITKLWFPQGTIARYDFLLLYAIGIQAALLLTRMETWREACVVILFHLLATAMEIFKTSSAIGSWSYPGDASFRIAGVPLFAGFLYSAVGSYIARAWRIFDFQFARFPHPTIAAAIALLAYANFFSHHFLPDLRWLLIIATIIAYARTSISFTPAQHTYSMPLVPGLLLVTCFLWIAENIGTLTSTWLYPNQTAQWQFVGWGKFTSWFLLVQLSFVLIYLLRLLETQLAYPHKQRHPTL